MVEAEPKKILVDWLVKIKILKDQIEKLEKLKSFPIFAISAFLLKSQIIEFELKQFIFSLDLYLNIKNTSKLFKRKIRTPRDLEDLTLFQLLGVIKEFEGYKIEELKSNLGSLNSRRKEFAHHLFSQGKSVKKLTEDAEEGLKVANKVLELLEDIENEIKKSNEKRSQ